MKIAIVHDWFTVYGGAEKVIYQMLKLFPQADLFSVVDFLPNECRSYLCGKKAKTTFIQRLPFAKSYYPYYLSLMPYAIEQLDLSSYELILSSSTAVAKGVLTGPDQLHICYCNSPMRYAWDLYHDYLNTHKLQKGLKGWVAKKMFHYLRLWDVSTSHQVDEFIANSQFISKRLLKIYRRNSTVIHPPVEIEKFPLWTEKEEFYLTVSRLVPYKKTDLVVQAFNRMPQKKLLVIGEGPDFKKLKKIARPNVTLLGHQSYEKLKHYMQKAKGFVYAGKEDFGMVLVEAQSCGTPVIAYSKGGACEIVKDLNHSNPTGCFFSEQTIDSICVAVNHFEKEGGIITPQACHENAKRFSVEVFCQKYAHFVLTAWENFKKENDYENNYSSWRKWDAPLAPIQKPLSQAVSQIME